MSANETGTPRTKAATFEILSSLQSGTDKVVPAHFAEDLERELTALREERDRLRELLSQAAFALPEMSGPVHERIHTLRLHWSDQLRASDARTTAAEARLREVEKDAARYRWVRDLVFHGSDDFDLWYQIDVSWGDFHTNRTEAESLDAAADAALSRAGKGE